MDTATMFQECVNSAIQQVLDERTKAQGLKSLSDTERKPIMKDFFAKFK
jgi:predicted transposase